VIGWEECLQNNIFCVEWDIKLQSALSLNLCCVNLQLIARAVPSRQTFFKAVANGQEAMDDKV